MLWDWGGGDSKVESVSTSVNSVTLAFPREFEWMGMVCFWKELKDLEQKVDFEFQDSSNLFSKNIASRPFF